MTYDADIGSRVAYHLQRGLDHIAFGMGAMRLHVFGLEAEFPNHFANLPPVLLQIRKGAREHDCSKLLRLVQRLSLLK
jgi:hypothetical protein